MNSPLFTHIWKEWREQRASLAQITIVVAIGFMMAALLLPIELLENAIVRHIAASIPLIILCGTIVPDLLSRERKNGGLEFLARTPGGLRNAWMAKLVFAMLIVAAAALGGELATQLIFEPLESANHVVWTPLGDPTALLIIVTLIVWTFATSAWLSNGLLALPCAVILTMATVAPALWMSTGFNASRVQGIFYALVPLGAAIGLCGSWFAFVSGPRRGRSNRWITAVGAGCCVLGLVPSLAPAAIRAGFPPREFFIEPVALNDDGTFLFNRVIRTTPGGNDDLVTAFEVDLATRNVRQLGEDGEYIAFQRAHQMRHAPPLQWRGLDAQVVQVDDFRSMVLTQSDSAAPRHHPNPADFGRAEVTNRFSVGCEGGGHSLAVHRGQSTTRSYRDRSGERVFSLEQLSALAPQLSITSAVVTASHSWLVRDGQFTWWWLDLRDGAHERCDALQSGPTHSAKFCPSTQSGELLVADGAGLKLLDSSTHEWRVVEGGASVRNLLSVLDEHACSVLADDAFVWISVYLAESAGRPRPAALRVDIANARVTERILFDELTALPLAANDDGVLYQEHHGRDVLWYDLAADSAKRLIARKP